MESTVKETLEDFNPFSLINNKLNGIEEKLLEVLETQANNPRVEIVSGEALCERFSVTRQTLGRWRDQGRIPFIQIGSIVRYDYHKVIEALKKSEVTMMSNRKGQSHQLASNIESSSIKPTITQNRIVKYTKYALEIKAVREYLMTRTATATMVSHALDIYRPSMCRIKRELEKKGLIKEIGIGICKVTGFRAAYLTTDPILLKGGSNG